MEEILARFKIEFFDRFMKVKSAIYHPDLSKFDKSMQIDRFMNSLILIFRFIDFSFYSIFRV